MECSAISEWERTKPFSFDYDGLPSSQLLAAWKKTRQIARDVKCHRGTITCLDPKTLLQVRADLAFYTDQQAMEWVLHFTNTGTVDTPIIDNIYPLSFMTGIPGNEMPVLHYNEGSVHDQALSRGVGDYQPYEKPLPVGARLELPKEKMRSQTFLPYFNLAYPGGGLCFGIGWTGQWTLKVERTADRLKLLAGQQHTRLRLHPGETIRTPAILCINWQGENRHLGSNLMRRTLLAHYAPRLDNEVVVPPIALFAGKWNDSFEQWEMDGILNCAGLPVETYWRDAGWYPGGFPGVSGTWEWRKDGYPDGPAAIKELTNKQHLKFLLWFEPERVTNDSAIHAGHPEWLLCKQEEGWHESKGAIFGFQDMLFDLGNPEARQWMTRFLSQKITEWGVDIYRQDRNFILAPYWRANDAEDRQGITEIRYVEGLYALLDELRQRHPRLIIDNSNWRCTGPDFEMMRRSSGSFTRSEVPDLGTNQTLTQVNSLGLNLYLPLHANGLHELSPYAARSLSASGLYYDWRGDTELCRQMIAEITRLRPLYLGDFHPLTQADLDETRWCGWQFHRPDLEQGCAVFFRRAQCPLTTFQASLYDLEAKATYEVHFSETFTVRNQATMTGEELARYAVRLDTPRSSLLVEYRKTGSAKSR